jgi:hypothetical protein
MSKIRVSYESERGCGFRKKGGLYLVGGELSAPCGKLPIPLHVCPTCGGGVKATRAWQWIKPRLLFSGAKCRFETDPSPDFRRQCCTCICGDQMPERGGLLWIGGVYYKTPEDFMKEARHQGVSRRIPTVPKGLEPGKTVVYLAHREVPDILGLDKTAGVEIEKMPAVFSAFIPRAVEYVVKGTETEEELERFEKRGIELVDVKPMQGTLLIEGEVV